MTDEVMIQVTAISSNSVRLCIEVYMNGRHEDKEVTLTVKEWVTVKLVRTVTEEVSIEVER